jgi:hypothetical protein
MHRAVVVASFAILALAPSTRIALAQASVTGDSVAHSSAEAAPVVDTASRKLTLESRDRTLGNCASRSQNPVGYVLPLFCAQRMNGAMNRADFDSVTFVRNGRSITLSARDARALALLNHQRRVRVVTGALIGGGLGLASAAFVAVRSDMAKDGRFVATALTLSGMGALIGGFSGSRYWGNWPRTLQDAQH